MLLPSLRPVAMEEEEEEEEAGRIGKMPLGEIRLEGPAGTDDAMPVGGGGGGGGSE